MEIFELRPRFVAREHELATLKSHLRRAIEGHGGLVLIKGESGIGKTRLAEELMKEADPSNVTVLLGRTVPHNLTPYLIFADAFEELFEESGESKSKPLIRADVGKELGIKGWILGPKTSKGFREIELEPQFERERLFESVAYLLLRTSKARPVLIVLDDLQWADPASLGLLHYLARRIGTAATLIIANEDTDETGDAAGHSPTFLDTLRMLRKENLIEEISLDRLNPSEMAELVGAALKGDFSEELAEILYGETEGNPFFALESLRLFIQDGILTKIDSTWRLQKPIERIHVPLKVQEVLQRRLDGLPSTEREVLECSAVIGDTFRSSLLEKLLEIDRSKLLRSLSDLEKKYHLIYYAKDGYHFVHSKIRRVLYDELGEELRAQYHLEIAENLAGVAENGREAPLASIAYHYSEAGAKQKAIHYNRMAAEEAAHRGEIASAELLVEKALQLSPSHPDAEVGRLEIVMSTIDSWREKWDKAREHCEAALKIFREIGDASGEARALHELGSIEIRSPQSDALTAERYLTQALERSAVLRDPDFEAGVHISLALLLSYRLGDIEKTMVHIDAVEAWHKTARNPTKRQNFLMLKGWVNLKMRGDYSVANSNFEEAAALAQEIHDIDTISASKFGLACSAYYQGRIRDAEMEFKEFSNQRAREGDLAMAVESMCFEAECALMQNEVEGFLRMMAALEDPKLAEGVLSRLIYVRALQGLALGIREDWEKADYAFSESMRLAEHEVDVERSSYSHYLYGIALRARGRNREAATHLARATELLKAFSRLGILANFEKRKELLLEALQLASKKS